MIEKDELFWAEIEKAVKQTIVKPKTCLNCRKVLRGRYFENDDGETFCSDCAEDEGAG